ncbi:MAG: stalk domain-containing protein [Cellulosilyticaceae bacterium]
MKLKQRALLIATALMITVSSISAEEVTANTTETSPIVTEKAEEQPIDPLTDEIIEEGEQLNPIDVIPEEQNDGKQILLTVGKGKVTVDGNDSWLSAVPVVLEGQVYMPMKFAIENILDLKLAESSKSKTITITGKDINVQLTKDSKEAITNGKKVTLSQKVVVDKGTTMIPISALKELFGVNSTKQDTVITLTTGGNPTYKSTIPQANFSFIEEEYTAGQVVDVNNQSFDEDGDTIAEMQWMINNDPAKTSKTLHPMFKTPWPGTYDVSLKVKDTSGMWSGWYTKKITVKPNVAPVVTNLEASKEKFSCGDKLEFTYAYDNESWEAIKEEKWTYRKADETQAQRIYAKPERIFEEGTYTVGLRLIDAYGNSSEEKQFTVEVKGGTKGGEFEYMINNGKQGQVLANFQKFNYRSLKEAEHTIANEEGTLLVSDSPEAVTENGILYKDKLARNGTLLIHHINTFSDEENARAGKRLVVMVENTTSEPASIVVKNKAIAGPNTDILHLGQDLMHAYYKGAPETTYTLKPGERQYIYDSGKGKWKKNYLITGMLDFDIKGEMNMYVASIDDDAAIDNIPNMKIPARDGHVRGSYSVTDKYYDVTLTGKEPESVILCKEQAEWLHGYDGITEEEVDNRGNYGVLYHLKTTAKEDTTLILSPRGGVFKGAIKVNDNIFNVPDYGHLPGPERACYLGTFKKGEEIQIEYMLPNGSNAPVLLGFIPEKYWTEID